VYLLRDSMVSVPVVPVTGLVCLGVILAVSFLSTAVFGRLALRLRRALIETGQLTLSDAEAAGWFVLPYFLLLALLGVWYGPWMEGLALAALVAGAGLSLYALSTRKEKQPGRRFWRRESAELLSGWPGIVLGLTAPLLPTLSAGLAVLALPVRFVPFLDNHPEQLGGSISGMVGEYVLYQALAFVGLLLLFCAVTGLIALFGTLRAALGRNG
jgi:hypothetical protein